MESLRMQPNAIHAHWVEQDLVSGRSREQSVVLGTSMRDMLSNTGRMD
jgi:hypothetical protein